MFKHNYLHDFLHKKTEQQQENFSRKLFCAFSRSFNKAQSRLKNKIGAPRRAHIYDRCLLVLWNVRCRVVYGYTVILCKTINTLTASTKELVEWKAHIVRLIRTVVTLCMINSIV